MDCISTKTPVYFSQGRINHHRYTFAWSTPPYSNTDLTTAIKHSFVPRLLKGAPTIDFFFFWGGVSFFGEQEFIFHVPQRARTFFFIYKTLAGILFSNCNIFSLRNMMQDIFSFTSCCRIFLRERGLQGIFFKKAPPPSKIKWLAPNTNFC